MSSAVSVGLSHLHPLRCITLKNCRPINETVYSGTIISTHDEFESITRMAIKWVTASEFEKECQAIQLLTATTHHEGLIQVWGQADPDLTKPDGYTHGICMELAQTDLAQAITHHAHKTPPPTEWVTFATQLFTAITTLHERGLVHGDIKSANALIVTRKTPVCVLGDFGSVTHEGHTQHEGCTYPLPSGLPVSSEWDRYGWAIIIAEMTSQNVTIAHGLHHDSPTPDRTPQHLKRVLDAIPVPITVSPRSWHHHYQQSRAILADQYRRLLSEGV